MDIHIQEEPEVEVGDLVFVDDMMRGQQLMVIEINRTIIKDDEKGERKIHCRVGLLNLNTGRLTHAFTTIRELQNFLDKLMCSIKKKSDYTMNLRRK